MKKSFRIKKSEEFSRIFQTGTSYANRQFVVYVLERPELEAFRVGITVGRKLGNAVVRNRTKRRVRELVREHQTQLDAGKDYIIIARKPVLDMSHEALSKSFVHVMKRAKSYHAKT
ncbi:ribonuclease P protein component [Salsuginibacillus halophilus]|uniref:Ribonuclease P protein component n=1 Tax=Salsuginibacillus halophilus TaxID=517424 RepID=A0A2P8HIE9_9BACI|nr:ribonuclease P protein component [Salsuginibacillus halophilus]PSL45940.1 ribonuclease P protein component [Salsuginibacillus halophilus]